MTRGSLIWKNLTRSRLRFALTLFAIFIAFFLFGLIQSFDRALNAGADIAAANRLVVSNKINFTQPLPLSYVNRIKTIEGVDMVTHQNWMGSYYQEPRNFIFGFAVDPESFLAIYADDIALPPEQAKAFINDRRGMIAGANEARKYGWKLGDLIPISSNIWEQTDGSKTWELVLDGIFEISSIDTPANGIYLHYDYLNESRTFGKDSTGTIVIATQDAALNDEIANAIDTRFLNSPFATETRTEAAFNASFIEQLGNISLIIISVVGAALFTILIIVSNTMAMSVRERTGEIGVMKALGFPAKAVFALILSEALLLALIGGFLGMGAAWLMATATAGVPGFPLRLVLYPDIWLMSLGVMIVLGLLTGLLPAWTAYRINIAAAFTRA